MPSKLAALAPNPPARTARRLTRFTVLPPIDLSPERNKHSTELWTPPASNLPGSTMLASADGRNGAEAEAAEHRHELPLSAERRHWARLTTTAQLNRSSLQKRPFALVPARVSSEIGVARDPDTIRPI